MCGDLGQERTSGGRIKINHGYIIALILERF